MKRILLFLVVALTVQLVNAQSVGIGTIAPNASAMLEINSPNKGLLLPRVADTSSVASPAKGLVIYSNNNNKLWFYNGSRWQQSSSNAGGMDSIWYKTQDTIAYTMKPYVGINADYSLIDPQANLQVNGSLLIQGKLIHSLAEPTAGQTYTMNNIATTQTIPSTDSVFRIYDPGGTGNYNNNMQGNVYASAVTYCSGYKISSVAADFGLGTGDTLWISRSYYPGCKEDYDYMFTNTTINPADFVVSSSMYSHCYFIFRSNADGNNNKGFNFKVTRLFNNQPYKQINISGPALSFNGTDGSFAAGNRAFAAAASVAIGSTARANKYGSTAIGWAEASGYYSTAIGTGYYYPNVASGERSLAVGVENTATALYAAAIGTSNDATGERSFAIGQSNTASAMYTSAFGISNSASGERSTSVGFSNRSKAFLSMTIGCYNDTSASVSATSWVASDPLLIVGNGNSSTRSNAMVVLKNGNVGIGLNSAAERLDVNGNIRSRNNLLVDNDITAAGNVIVTGNIGIGTVSPASSLHIVGGVIQIEDETMGKFGSNSFEFSCHIVPLVDNSRSLGLSTRRFTQVYATNGTINTSDVRDKTKIADINYGLSEIMRLRPVSFQWKNTPQSGTKLGLIAQEVETVLPEVVANPNRNPALLTENEDKATARLGMYYSDLIPVLIKAIQEQEEKIKKLEEEVAGLKGTPGQAKKM